VSAPAVTPTVGKRVAAEFLGALTLVAVVVGSGIMGANLTDDLAVVLLINALAIVAGLGVLIWVLGPANVMFALPAVEMSQRERSGSGLWLGEVGAGLTAYFFPRSAHMSEPLDLPEAIHDHS